MGVDPAARTFQVSELADGKWLEVSTMAEAETVSAPPFETMKILLTRLWKDQLPVACDQSRMIYVRVELPTNERVSQPSSYGLSTQSSQVSLQWQY